MMNCEVMAPEEVRGAIFETMTPHCVWMCSSAPCLLRILAVAIIYFSKLMYCRVNQWNQFLLAHMNTLKSLVSSGEPCQTLSLKYPEFKTRRTGTSTKCKLLYAYVCRILYCLCPLDLGVPHFVLEWGIFLLVFHQEMHNTESTYHNLINICVCVCVSACVCVCV